MLFLRVGFDGHRPVNTGPVGCHLAALLWDYPPVYDDGSFAILDRMPYRRMGVRGGRRLYRCRVSVGYRKLALHLLGYHFLWGIGYPAPSSLGARLPHNGIAKKPGYIRWAVVRSGSRVSTLRHYAGRIERLERAELLRTHSLGFRFAGILGMVGKPSIRTIDRRQAVVPARNLPWQYLQRPGGTWRPPASACHDDAVATTGRVWRRPECKCDVGRTVQIAVKCRITCCRSFQRRGLWSSW